MLSSHQLQQSRYNLPLSMIGCGTIVLGTPLPKPTRQIYVGTAGNVLLTFADGTKATFMALPAGVYDFSIILAETTTGPASNMVALY